MQRRTTFRIRFDDLRQSRRVLYLGISRHRIEWYIDDVENEQYIASKLKLKVAAVGGATSVRILVRHR